MGTILQSVVIFKPCGLLFFSQKRNSNFIKYRITIPENLNYSIRPNELPRSKLRGIGQHSLICSVSGTDIRAVLYALTDIIPSMLADGKSVKLGEAGNFRVSIRNPHCS